MVTPNVPTLKSQGTPEDQHEVCIRCLGVKHVMAKCPHCVLFSVKTYRLRSKAQESAIISGVWPATFNSKNETSKDRSLSPKSKTSKSHGSQKKVNSRTKSSKQVPSIEADLSAAAKAYESKGYKVKHSLDSLVTPLQESTHYPQEELELLEED